MNKNTVLQTLGLLLVSFEALGFIDHSDSHVHPVQEGPLAVFLMQASIIYLVLMNLAVHENYLVSKPRKKKVVHYILLTLSLWLCLTGVLKVYTDVFETGAYLKSLVVFFYRSFSVPALTGLVYVTASVRRNAGKKGPT
ncbi:hypothetical protein [Larkinella soli]|uniref:hypothetical protein n=1 Tax=Larkinella soli TaxID=1770527 RepID=UPI000FFBB190|nr:hypothetical protein [Larkinella soli]